MIWFLFFSINGVIGTIFGFWIQSGILGNWGNPWMFGLIGFLIGFIGCPIYLCLEEEDII